MLKVFIFLNMLLLVGCTSLEHAPIKYPYSFNPTQAVSGQNVVNQKKKIVIFFDGTDNTELSHTNISKLHKLASLQNRNDIHTIYIHGVGTDKLPLRKVTGLGLGFGIDKDVQQAYEFIANRYNPKNHDEIYLFGFSRGAYAARILAGMIDVAGIIDTSQIKPSKTEGLIKRIYEAHRGEKTIYERRADVFKVIGTQGHNAQIEFMGLWDTIAALGVPPSYERVGYLNPNYNDQLCNVKKAAHAVSIDDNRLTMFTPVLLTQNELVQNCTEKKPHEIVSEVWFSGVHADVGGGYDHEDGSLSGVSLNWMLENVRTYNIFPENSAVRENIKGISHDPDTGKLGVVYWRGNRNLPKYHQLVNYPKNLLPVHRSVFERLKTEGKDSHGFDWVGFNRKGEKNYQDCFKDPRDPKTNKVIESNKENDFKPCKSRRCLLSLKENQQCFEIK